MSAALRSHVSGTWHTPTDEGRPLHDAVTGDEVARISSAGSTSPPRSTTAAGRRAGAARADVPPARRPAQGARRAPARAPRGAVRGLGADRRHARRLQVRRRRRHRRAARLRVEGPSASCPTTPSTSTATSSRSARAARSSASTSAPRCTASRCRSTRSTSRCGARWRSSRPRSSPACRRVVKPASPTAFLTAKLVELIVDSGLLPDGRAAVRRGRPRRHVRPPHRPGPGRVHRLGVHRADAAHAPRRSSATRCGSPPRPTRSTSRRSAPTPRPARRSSTCSSRAAGHRDDGEGRAEVHRDPPRVRAGAARRRRRRGRVGGSRRSPSATRTPRACGWARSRAWSSARRCGAASRRCADAGRIVFGDPDSVEVVDADAERGAFVSPMLLVGDPERAEPHEVEAFGPVSTVLPYASTAQLIDFAARGQGSLAGSVVTADPAFAREVVLGVGAVARPAAGAQRRRREGVDRPRLADAAARARRPRPRRRRRGDGRHPRRAAPHAAHRRAGRPGHAHRDHRPLGRRVGAHARPTCTRSASTSRSCRLGDTLVAGPRTVSQEDVEHFAEFTGDTFYAHMDAEAAAANPLFGERVAHGYLIVSLAAGLFVDPRPGPGAGQLRRRQPALPHARSSSATRSP